MKNSAKKQFGIFFVSVILLTVIFIIYFNAAGSESISIFIPLPVIISVFIFLFFLFVLEKALKARKDETKIMRKNWQIGFFGFFALFAIPGIIRGEWIWAAWLVWIVWFLYLLPVEKTRQ